MIYPGQSVFLCPKCHNPYFEVKTVYLYENTMNDSDNIVPIEKKKIIVCLECGHKVLDNPKKTIVE